jgi:hypothetical protein
MVSPALSQLLERARVRFGLEVEVFDAGLNPLYPEGGTHLARVIQDSPVVRRTLLDALAGGRAERIDGAGAHYRLYPLRQSAGLRQASGLLAIRRSGADGAMVGDAEPWSDLARAVVETDLASSETLAGEQQRSRRLSGAFRFVEFITESKDEATLTESLVQAAAVWYDVDARLYRRDLTGDYVLETWLPGAALDAAPTRLNRALVTEFSDLRRLVSAAELGPASNAAVNSNDALLVPIGVSGEADRVLVSIGSVPVEADVVLRLVSRVAAVQFDALARERTADARREFDGLLADTTKVPELIAVRVIHALAQSIQARSGSLSLTRQGMTRRIAAVGPSPSEERASVPAESQLTPDRLVCRIVFGGGDFAVLDMQVAPSRQFSVTDAMMAESCARALRTWLAGTLTSFDATAAILDVPSTGVPAFLTRIQEELERARRFDLRLSLILVDVPARPEAMAALQEALRRELRGSDVTGAMGGTQVAALLTHTDALGLDNVVRRLRQRLADTAERLNVSDLKLGQAAYSPEVRTADALLEMALRQAEPVIVH